MALMAVAAFTAVLLVVASCQPPATAPNTQQLPAVVYDPLSFTNPVPPAHPRVSYAADTPERDRNVMPWRYAWSPAGLCDFPQNRWTTRGHDGWTTMGWCPNVASALIQYPGWTIRDLLVLMSIMGCESSGDPYWNQANWGTSPMSVFGLYAHRRVYWADRSYRYVGHLGVHYSDDQHDDISVAVGLYMKDGPWHWDGCWPAVKHTIGR